LTQRIKITISSKEIYEKLSLKKYAQELIKEIDMKLKRLNEDPLAKYINVNNFNYCIIIFHFILLRIKKLLKIS